MKLHALLALPLLALVAGCGSGSTEEEAARPVVEVSVASVTRGSIRSILESTGTLAPLPDREAKVSPLAPGRIRTMLVTTGDKVARGQTIATLDPGASAGLVEQARASVRVAEATLDQARVNLQLQTRAQSSSVSQAMLNVQAQRIALAKLRAGSRPQEVAQAEAALAGAQATLANAEQNLTRSRTLFGEGLLARKDLESAQAEERTARAAVTSAEQALSMAKQGNRPEDVRAGELALAQAEQELKAARGQDVQNAAKKQDVLIAEGQLSAARAALQSTVAQARTLTIVSPVEGTVVGRTVNPGETVDVTTVIATIVNLDRVRILLNVPPDRVGQITPGDVVEFSADVDPQLRHSARITVVNQALDPTSNTVQVEAVADNADRTLKDDGFVKASIVTRIRSNAILVPASALVDKDGKATVFVAGDDGVAHAVEVRTGVREGDRVEVLGGLKQGQQVVTAGAFELEDGTKIKAGQ